MGIGVRLLVAATLIAVANATIQQVAKQILTNSVSPSLKTISIFHHSGEQKTSNQINCRCPPGPPGLPGAPGEPGAKGYPGQAGAKGKTGKIGKPGKRGKKGRRGRKGRAGSRGKPGPPGSPGRSGTSGPRGGEGVEGPTGPPGPVGPPGRQGDIGRPGLPGPAGDRGKRGRESDEDEDDDDIISGGGKPGWGRPGKGKPGGIIGGIGRFGRPLIGTIQSAAGNMIDNFDGGDSVPSEANILNLASFPGFNDNRRRYKYKSRW